MSPSTPLTAGPASSGGWWLAAADVYVDEPSNRLLFTSLTGESTGLGIEPVAPLRGLPHDVTTSVRTAYHEWASAALAVSWVTYPELLEAVERVRASIDGRPAAERQKEQFHANQIGVSIQAVLSYMAVYATHGFETRLIFWTTPI